MSTIHVVEVQTE